MKQLIAYCGLDCEKCDAYIATVKDDNVLREKTARLWSEMNGVEITPEMINCLGCRADGVKTPFCDGMCEIRLCASSNKLETCRDCDRKGNCKSLCMITSTNKEASKNING